MTESNKNRLREQRENGKCEIDDFCTINHLEKEDINEYQIRVFGKCNIDIYPTNRKYCILRKFPVWGKYQDLKELLILLNK